MSTHRFTDETATTAALHAIVNDMHHTLGRIAEACTMAWFLLLVATLANALGADWVGAGLTFAGSVAFFIAGYNTWKRRRKYHPGAPGTSLPGHRHRLVEDGA